MLTATLWYFQVNLSALEPKESELSSMAKEMDEYFQTELLFKRNEIMAERIERILNDNPRQSFFFAFGAGMSNLTDN